MQSRRPFVALSLLLAALAGPAAQAQTPGPAPGPSQAPPQPAPRPPRPHPPRAVSANICTTDLGWCQLPTLTAPHGVGCVCLTAHNQQVPGVTRFFPYEGPASPYLQPHAGPPTTIK
jgi:hypothetical protein